MVILLALGCPNPLSAAGAAAGIEDGQRAFDQHDYAAARRIWSDLAEAGDAEAAYRMGVLADVGGDVPPDPKAALDWYGRAADSGHPSAEFNVGVLLDSGLAGARDAALAAIWYARAATHGHGRAMYNLAQLYAQGDGVPINPAMAAAWYRAAAGAHVAAATGRRDDPRPGKPLAPHDSRSPLPPLLVVSCSAPCSGSAVPEPTEPTVVELVWNAPQQVRLVRFFVEVMARDDAPTSETPSKPALPRIVASRYEAVSATAVRLASNSRYSWRVYTVSTDVAAADYVIGPWNEFVIGPVAEKPTVPASADALTPIAK